MEECGSKLLARFNDHLRVLRHQVDEQEFDEAASCPLFTAPVFKCFQSQASNTTAGVFQQFGLLGGMVDLLNEFENVPSYDITRDPRLFANISPPTSTFICGSQGSGKSHTLSCLLENCLIKSYLNNLANPLTALLFHFDSFISDKGGSPCEAAFLSSHSEVEVRVLCAPTNLTTIKRAYHALNVVIEPLRIDERDLNTKRMLDLMAVKPEDGPVPLYVHTVNRILREMRMEQQALGTPFSLNDFKARINSTDLIPTQVAPLMQRLETLESFISLQEPFQRGKKKGKLVASKGQSHGNSWTSQAGTLTIIDLSCPCINAQTACAMFNVCLSIFLEQDMEVGRVVALDEAHKYMHSSPEAAAFTETILSTIRLQRHLGTRIYISTQEPTISPKLLDLSTAIIVHRFTSPEWLKALKQHVAISGSNTTLDSKDDESVKHESTVAGQKSTQVVFSEIVGLGVGEALVFSPNAMVGVETTKQKQGATTKLGSNYLRVRIRSRLTEDGGRSIFAT